MTCALKYVDVHSIVRRSQQPQDSDFNAVIVYSHSPYPNNSAALPRRVPSSVGKSGQAQYNMKSMSLDVPLCNVPRLLAAHDNLIHQSRYRTPFLLLSNDGLSVVAPTASKNVKV